MRAIRILALGFAGAAAFAEAAADHAAGQKPPVNTVCPVDGAKIDARIAPIAGKTKEGKTVMIAVCSDGCADQVRAHPEAYADDAVANRRHEERAK